MELIGPHLKEVKVEEGETNESNWPQPGQERKIEGFGDSKLGNMEGQQMEASNTGGGDGFVYEEEIIMNEPVPDDENPNSTDFNAGDAAARMYEEIYAEEKRRNEEEQAAVIRQREEDVRQVKKAIEDEMRKKAQMQAAEALKRHKAAEKAAHDKYLNDLKLQLAALQNPMQQTSPGANRPPAPQYQSTPQGSYQSGNVAYFAGRNEGVSVTKPSVSHSAIQYMQGGGNVNPGVSHGNKGQSYNLQVPQSSNVSSHTPAPLYVPATRPQLHTPQKNMPHLMQPSSGNRRSPRANISSLALDASRKQEAPLVSSRPASATGNPIMQDNASSAFFNPVAASSPAKGTSRSTPAWLSPKSKKRPPTVTGQVLEQFLDRKKAKKQGTPTKSPSAKGATSVTTEDLKSQSERKYNLAKALDSVLKETLKQGNINRIKKQVDDAGFQAIPVPEPMPKDLFCYTVSMYMMDIAEQDPTARAAIVRKNCLDYIVSQMFTFAEVSSIFK